MQFPHRLTLRPSRRLAAILLFLHAAGLYGLYSSTLPFWSKLALSVVIVLSCLAAIYRHVAGRAANAVRELLLREDGRIEARLADGSLREASVSGRSTLWPWLIVLQLEGIARVRGHSLVILPDALACNDWRVLCAWLRWKSAQPVAQDGVSGPG